MGGRHTSPAHTECRAGGLRGRTNIRGRDAVSLLVRDDLHTAVLEHTDAGVGGAEVDANHWAARGALIVVRREHGGDSNCINT